jgi:hypothetical protein
VDVSAPRPATAAARARAQQVRRLNEPQPARVKLDLARRPESVLWWPGGDLDRRASARQGRVEHVLDTWYVDEGWWTASPVRRMYYECQLEGGIRLILVYDLITHSWFVQR